VESFWTPLAPRPLGVADFNGDGFDDLVVGTTYRGNVTIYLSGPSGLGPGVTDDFYVDVREFLPGDFDEDGDHDVVVVEWQGGAYTLLRNDGAGNLTSTGRRGGFGDIYGADSGDLNGDGHLDLAFADGASGVYVLLGDGAGAFSVEEVPHDDLPVGIVLVDLDQDGDLDLVVTNGDDHQIAVFRNRGNASFDPPIQYPGGIFPAGLDASDLDRDGYPDVVLGTGWYTFGVFMNDHNGGLLSRVDYPCGSNAGGFGIADFDRNGYDDLAVCIPSGDSVAIVLNANGEIVSVLVAAITHEVVDGAVVIKWHMQSDAWPSANVYRREGEAWEARGVSHRDVSGTFEWTDTDVAPGDSFEYRIGVVERGREVFVGSLLVSIPAAWALSISAVHPNPTIGHVWATFTLPSSKPASISIHDVTGRRTEVIPVGALGAGRHVVNLTEGRTLAPGLYLVRLDQGGIAATGRICVIR
jgi:hypothetical protein